MYRLHGEKAGDPLTDARLGDLRRDITLFTDLGLNVLFVGTCTLLHMNTSVAGLTTTTDNIDPTCIHDQSMRLLAEAGIYVLVVRPLPNTQHS